MTRPARIGKFFGYPTEAEVLDALARMRADHAAAKSVLKHWPEYLPRVDPEKEPRP